MHQALEAMNSVVAALHRRRAAAIRALAHVDAEIEEAIADELEDKATAPPPAPRPREPQRRESRIPRGIVASDADRARARKLASDAGILRAGQEP